MDYYSKYIKYKTKYFHLKTQLGGVEKICHICLANGAKCIFEKCTEKHSDEINKVNADEFKLAKEDHVDPTAKESHCYCGHQQLCHNAVVKKIYVPPSKGRRKR